MLGEFRLDGVELTALRSRKARVLLKVLALAGGATVATDALVDTLWGDDLPDDPGRDLAVLVSRGRTLLGAERLPRREGGYALVADWCDRDELAALSREAARRHALGDIAGSRAAAETALALVRGELLADEQPEAWLLAARASTAALVAVTRAIAAEAALAGGQFGDAATHARSALEHDPFDEAALRLLMRAHAAAGRPASALAANANTRATRSGFFIASRSPTIAPSLQPTIEAFSILSASIAPTTSEANSA